MNNNEQQNNGSNFGSMNTKADIQYYNSTYNGNSQQSNYNIPNNGFYQQPINNGGNKAGKATAATIQGILSLSLSIIGIILFWGSCASVTSINVDGTIVGMMSSIILSIIAFIVGVVGIVTSIRCKTATNTSKATTGMVLSILGVIFAGISLISTGSCMGCVMCTTQTVLDDVASVYDSSIEDFNKAFDEYNELYGQSSFITEYDE